MNLAREQIADILFTAAIVGTGMVLQNPVIAQVIQAIGAGVAANLTWEGWQHACRRLIGPPSRALNHDLQRALIRAFDRTFVHLEQAWWQTPRGDKMRRSEPKAAQLTSEVFQMLREDAAQFCTPDRFGRAAGNDQVQELLYGNETTVRQILIQSLAGYLHGHDPQLQEHIESHLLSELAFCFGEELKAGRPGSERAWKAFERLLLEGLQAGVREVQDDQAEILRMLEAIQNRLVELEKTTRPVIPNPPAPRRLPQPRRFVGRQSGLAYFARKLETTRLAVITGMVGVGKSALAATLARQVADPDTIYWHTFRKGEGIAKIVYGLAGFLAWHGEDNLWRMLYATELNDDQSELYDMALDHLIHALHGQRYLIYLDDFHHVDSFAQIDSPFEDLVQRLHTEIPDSQVSTIIASWRLPAFVRADQFKELEGLSLDDTRRLLAESGLSLSDDLPEKLHERTEGNALFLELAIAALQRTSDPARLIARLGETRDIKRYLLTQVDKVLSDDQQAVMEAISVLLDDPGTPDAIETVLDGREIAVLELLDDLQELHLLAVEEGDIDSQYRQHDIVQDFYYRRLSRGQQLSMHSRAGEHYEIYEPDVFKAIRHFERAEKFARAARLVTLDNVWRLINRGLAVEVGRLLERFTADQLDTVLWAQINLGRGQIYALLGEGQLALDSYEGALLQLDVLSDPLSGSGHHSLLVSEFRAQACLGLGDLLQYSSPDEALGWLQRGLDESADISSSMRAALHNKIGSVQIAKENYGAASSAVQKCLDLLPEDPSQLRISALINLGTIYGKQGDLEEAENYKRQALEMSRHLHDIFRTMIILIDLGIIQEYAGDWPGALDRYLEALELAERIGSIAEQARCENQLGALYIKQGDHEAALAHLSKALELARSHNLREYVIYILLGLSDLRIQQEEWEAAESALNEAEPLVREMGTEPLLPYIHCRWAQIQLGKEQHQPALDNAEQAVALSGEPGMSLEKGIRLRVLGQALLAGGRSEKAMASFEESLSFLAGRDSYEAVRTKMQWGLALVFGKDAARGMRLLQEARSVFQKLGAKHDLLAVDEVLNNLR